ncbi:uncharacterized protein LOC108732947 isoform X2 [Agrilus planipennis]|nr:uncharacterized protein LOC108732947 isoform X2 [Agrilus planipennis]XP_018319456.1 uncharacterized protein LOC108732947 isoform X2 [Agrilus planipennis]XP_025835876.1 uncharacterized protein LOC108732947 isoform X2 [Agrilus planipennis]
MDFLDHASSGKLGERGLFGRETGAVFLNKNCNETASNDTVEPFDNLNGNKLTINGAESFSRKLLLKNCENFANFVEATTSNTLVYENIKKSNPDRVLVGNQLKVVRLESQIQTSSGCNFPKYTLCFDGADLENGFKNEVNHENVNSNSIEWCSLDENQTVECIDLSKQSTSLDHFDAPCNSKDSATKGTQVHTQDDIEDGGHNNKTTLDIAAESDDDVVFVKEYKLPVKTPQEANADVPKRRNPRRKVQLEKASVDLINKLTIPPSVFNARVRKSTRKPVPTKKCRRSNRLTKIVSNPLSPLNRSDLRDWPDDGMHERPVYNETTNSIDKLDPFLKNKQAKTSNKENQSPSTRKLPKKAKRKKNIANKKRKEQEKEIDLSFLVHERLQLILGYISQLKIYERVMNNTSSSASDGVANQKQFPFVYELLTDASVLYSIVNGVEQTDMAKYLTSVDPNEALNFLKTYFTNLEDSNNKC